MRRHFIYPVSSFVPSPTGRGSMEEWLEGYKLQVAGETYVRMVYDGIPPAPGDILWFQVDERVLACVPVQAVREDQINGGYEFWYIGEDVQRVRGVRCPPQKGALTALLGDQWLL